MTLPQNTRLTILFYTAIFLGISVASVAAGVALGTDMTTIDDNHPLTTDDAINDYEDDGIVTRNLTQLNLEITIADDPGPANVSGPELPFSFAGVTKTYVCLDYRESISRTIRLYIPDAYLQPRVNAELTAINSDTTAAIEPVNDSSATSMTVQFTGAERACFAYDWTRGYYFGIKDWTNDIVNQTTGITLPSLSGDSQPWAYVNTAALQNESTVTIPRNGSTMTIQYDDTPNDNESTWITVPDCNDPEDQDICRFQDDSGNVTLMDASPPVNQVRYKQGTDISSVLQSAVNDLLQVPDRIMEYVDNILGGNG